MTYMAYFVYVPYIVNQRELLPYIVNQQIHSGYTGEPCHVT